MYSDDVMQAIRQNLGLEPDDISRDSEIFRMSKLEAFEKCLNWENIVGYSGIILNFINGIYNVNLEPEINLEP